MKLMREMLKIFISSNFFPTKNAESDSGDDIKQSAYG